MKTEKYVKLMWPTIIVVTVAIFLIQIYLHTDTVFDYCICQDGTISYSEGRGTCSWHGGTKEIVYREIETIYTIQDVSVIVLLTAVVGPLLGMGLFILIVMFIKKIMK